MLISHCLHLSECNYEHVFFDITLAKGYQKKECLTPPLAPCWKIRKKHKTTTVRTRTHHIPPASRDPYLNNPASALPPLRLTLASPARVKCRIWSLHQMCKLRIHVHWTRDVDRQWWSHALSLPTKQLLARIARSAGVFRAGG